MQIDVKGRNVPVTDELREHVRKRFVTVDKQVPWVSARLEIEFSQARNPAVVEAYVAEATLYLKGVTLRARDCSPRDFEHALNLCSHELTRQVKRHRDKRRGRREARGPTVTGDISAAI